MSSKVRGRRVPGPRAAGSLPAVRLNVVSDVHAEAESLSRAAEGADIFACVGDLALYLDYDNPGAGAFAEVFGEDTAREYVALRTRKRFDEARMLAARRWEVMAGGVGRDERTASILDVIERQYRDVFAAMPTPALLTPGNVDVPAMWPRFLRSGHQVLDGSVAEVRGVRLAMVGGGLRSVYRTPNEEDEQSHAAKVAALGPSDVLLSHIPPAIPELTYDVVARRHEVGSKALLDYIRQYQPRYALFGHVHQPLAARTRIGRTECVNVGHFRATRRPWSVEL